MKKQILLLTTACCLVFASCEKSDETITPAGIETPMEANASESASRDAYVLDAEKSVVEWWGSGPAAAHHGSFAVTAENIEVVNGKIKEGTFIIPISSIQNFDLPDHIKPVLLDHLKSPDFFNMLLYPEAAFSLKKVLPLNKAVEGSVEEANYLVSGDFTMLGKTLAISFPARIIVSNGQLSIEAKLKIDRTRWGMTYASDPALGDHHIYPEVALHLKLNGIRQ